MRLIGWAVRHRPFFGQGAYLPVNDLTVLLGANDSGKSTLLRALARSLADPQPGEPGGALYFEVIDDELASLVGAWDRRQRVERVAPGPHRT